MQQAQKQQEGSHEDRLIFMTCLSSESSVGPLPQMPEGRRAGEGCSGSLGGNALLVQCHIFGPVSVAPLVTQVLGSIFSYKSPSGSLFRSHTGQESPEPPPLSEAGAEVHRF